MIPKPFVRQNDQTWLILTVNKNFKRPKTYYNYKSDNALGPVVRKPINANPGLNSNRGFNFLHPNHLHNHSLRINEKKSPIYNPKAKI